MRLSIKIFSIALLVAGCSSPKNEHMSSESAPFEDLQVIRVMLTCISNQVDQQQIAQTVLTVLKETGEVRTPSDTSLDKLLAAQAKPYALLTLNIQEIETSDSEKKLPVFSLSGRMYQKTELALNDMNWMSNVWEKIKYIEISEKNVNNDKLSVEIKNVVNEFSQEYRQANSTARKPVFYISPIIGS